MHFAQTVCDTDACVWRFPAPQLCVASAPFGGGIGLRPWVINAQVPTDYTRTDPEAHIRELADALACADNGVGMLTAASVRNAVDASDDGIEVCATVGLRLPTWAAAPQEVATPWRPGTINVFARLSVRLSPAALVNAVMTVTEAKVQALVEAGVPGTGTATDAVCVACAPDGVAEPFAGPRSRVGAPLARAVHAAIAQGIER